jgi:hypothetical protein
MVLALDSRIQHVWRTPDSLQFGVERPLLVLERVSAADERMLAALGGGVSAEGLHVVAKRAGARPSAVAKLLEQLTPVLAPARAERTEPPLVVLDGAGPTAAALERMLSQAGADVRSGLSWSDPVVAQAEAAVSVAAYAVEPQRHARWLRRDVPHLPVVFGDAGVSIGPFVRPGEGACLRCVDLHRTDADPAWPAMATQLHTRPAPGETAISSAAAAARGAAIVLAGIAGSGATEGAEVRAEVRAEVPEVRLVGPQVRPGVVWRLEAGAVEWVSRAWEPHPECGCLGLPA